MAGRGNPSFLKNQKAQKRVAKANAKRAARMAQNAEKAAGRTPGGVIDEENAAAPDSQDNVPETDTTPDEGAPPA